MQLSLLYALYYLTFMHCEIDIVSSILVSIFSVYVYPLLSCFLWIKFLIYFSPPIFFFPFFWDVQALYLYILVFTPAILTNIQYLTKQSISLYFCTVERY